MGELLAEMEERGEKAKKGGDRGGGRGHRKAKSGSTTLQTLGVGKDEAARAKKLAESSEGAFEHAIATAKKAGELSDQIVIREATKRDAERKQKLGDWPFRGTWSEEQIDEAEQWLSSLPKGRALKQRMAEVPPGEGASWLLIGILNLSHAEFLREFVARAGRGADAFSPRDRGRCRAGVDPGSSALTLKFSAAGPIFFGSR